MDLLEFVKYGDRSHNEVAERIVSELEDIHNESLIRIAIEHLENKRPGIRAAALDIVADCAHSWPLEEEPASQLLAALSDNEPIVRRAALRVASQTIGGWGQDSIVNDLIHCLADSCAENRAAAIELLLEGICGNLTMGNYCLLTEYLAHKDEGTRQAAREILLGEGQQELLDRYDPTVAGSEVVGL